MRDVTCLGILVADVVARPVEGLPGRGKLAMLERIELQTGGNAANTAIALAKLGVSCAAAGCVGGDGFGEFLLHRLRESGVETDDVVVDVASRTASTVVLVAPDGERSFLHDVGASGTVSASRLDCERLLNTRFLNIGGALVMPGIDGEPMADLLHRARAAGVTTSLDVVWDPAGDWMSRLAPCLPYVDYLLPSYEEASHMVNGITSVPEIACRLQSLGARNVGIKLGAEGCYLLLEGGRHVTVKAWSVPVSDTLGAGDAWVAGFLACLARRWDPFAAAEFANAVGALSVMGNGATSGVLPMEATLDWIAVHGRPVRTESP
ncbi:MAG: carbohydrate kinase family protein [Armatimonadetes bacterium]|nr:carbohydrate kinase family protein [Armatimonadota bacterium]MDE2206486.1 carbohydrate kinase family protein [Armatimonadota bacterium]